MEHQRPVDWARTSQWERSGVLQPGTVQVCTRPHAIDRPDCSANAPNALQKDDLAHFKLEALCHDRILCVLHHGLFKVGLAETFVTAVGKLDLPQHAQLASITQTHRDSPAIRDGRTFTVSPSPASTTVALNTLPVHLRPVPCSVTCSPVDQLGMLPHGLSRLASSLAAQRRGAGLM